MSGSATIPPGYRQLAGVSPAEDEIGPFYYRREGEGLRMGFRARQQNCNGIGSVHGGVLMCFADYAVTMLALSGVQEHCTTVSFNAQFMAAAREGDWIEASGEVLRRTGSLTFVRGQLQVDDRLLLSFDAVMKRLRKTGSEAG